MSKQEITPAFKARAHSAEVWLKMWKIAYNDRHYPDAEVIIREAKTAYPGNPEILNALGRTLRQRKDPVFNEEAMGAFKAAHEAKRSDIDFLTDYATFLRRFGKGDDDVAKAELMLAKAYMEFQHKNQRLLLLACLGDLYEETKPAWAMACYQHCLNLKPNDKRILHRIDKMTEAGGTMAYSQFAWEGLEAHMRKIIAKDAAVHAAPLSPKEPDAF